MTIKEKVRVRFAPSPTGFLHIGGLRTALFNWLFAKKNNGVFILRIEDTDRSRFVEKSLQDIYASLKWYGLNWDEGPDKNNKVGPYFQSQRLAIYRQYTQELVDKGKAYYCFCSEDRLTKMREEQKKGGIAPKYDRTCLKLSQKEIQSKIKNRESYVVRLKMPEKGVLIFEDLIRGRIKFHYDEIDDQILMKSDGFPTYHLAVVVDDHLMNISHVIRGEEWLPSIPKHIYLYQSFGWSIPQFAHLPMILGSDKSKLSKRHGAVSVLEYKELGYLPEAVINFIALLGWNPKTEQEIFSIEELINEFSLEKVNKAGAVFDLKKLDWLNGHYLRRLEMDKYYELCLPYLQEEGIEINDKEFIKKAIRLEKSRVKKLSEIGEAVKFFFEKELKYEVDMLIWKGMSEKEVKESLTLTKESLTKIPDNSFHFATLESTLICVIKEKGLETGKILWPLRAALSGRKASPSPFEIADVLGKLRTIERIEKAINLLK